VWLPCLRCGQQWVPVLTAFLRRDGSGSTWNCRSRPCEVEHFRSITQQGDSFVIAYQRYTLRYPLEFYDEEVDPLDVRLHVSKPMGRLNESGYVGPVVVYARKKRFSLSEIKSIWEACNPKKGKGFTEAAIHLGLGEFVRSFRLLPAYERQEGR
jgi:hypothetical protein